MCKLSIITINYNNAAGLEKTMQSVLSQTSQEFEYIVVDGGSTDSSCQTIKDKRLEINGITEVNGIRVTCVSEPDNGIYHAMNKGIRMAKGEYVQFVNSGDTLVDATVTFRMLYDLPKCSIFYGNMIKVFPGGHYLYNKEVESVSMYTFYIGTLNHSSAYIKRSLFYKYGFYDESLKIVSDWKFYLVVVGLNNESVEYRDVDITYFDMTGISNINFQLNKFERRTVLKELLPVMVLKDYDSYWLFIEQMKRLNRYPIVGRFVYFIERILFKYEKSRIKYKKEYKIY